MASDSKEVATDLSPLLKVYKDGRVERFFGSPYVPPSPKDPSTSVSSKDITISAEIKAENIEETMLYRVWKLVYPAPPGGLDNPMINPLADDAPTLSQLGCSRLFVCTSEKDELRDRAGLYVQTLKKSGWKGEVELVEIEGQDHSFHIFHLESEKAKSLVKRLAFCINNN